MQFSRVSDSLNFFAVLDEEFFEVFGVDFVFVELLVDFSGVRFLLSELEEFRVAEMERRN